MKLKNIAAVLVASSLFASSSFAAELPLPAGKPAGTKEAAFLGPNGVWIGLAVIAITVVAVVASNNGDSVTTPTTGTGA
jgi:hypothetical protein